MLNENQMNHGQEIHRQLLEPGRHASALLEPTDALLDRAAASVGLAIEPHAAIVGVLGTPSRNHRPDRVSPQPLVNARGALGLVPGHRLGTLTTPDLDPVHDRFELRALVDLPRRDVDREGDSVTFSNQVELAPESAAPSPVKRVSTMSSLPSPSTPSASRESQCSKSAPQPFSSTPTAAPRGPQHQRAVRRLTDRRAWVIELKTPSRARHNPGLVPACRPMGHTEFPLATTLESTHF